MDEEAVESGQTEDEVSADMESSEAVEIDTGEKDFPVIDPYVIEQDKSDEYGVYSISCFDLDQFLDENGHISEDWDWESKEYVEYSGRFAYPKLTPCRFFDTLYLDDRTDHEESLYGVDSETGNGLSINIYTGLDFYDDMENMIGYKSSSPNNGPYEYMFTAELPDGQTDVIAQWSIAMVSSSSGNYEEDENGDLVFVEDEEGATTEEYKTYHYFYSLGHFSVSLLWSGEELTQDEVQLIIDNIRLTNGTER